MTASHFCPQCAAPRDVAYFVLCCKAEALEDAARDLAPMHPSVETWLLSRATELRDSAAKLAAEIAELGEGEPR